MSDVKSYVNGVLQLSETAYRALRDCFEELTLPKDETFVKMNSRNTREYLVISGICRCYVLNPDGLEVTLDFYQAPIAITPCVCRTSNDLSTVNLEALVDSFLITFQREELSHLMRTNREIRDWGNLVLQKELLQKVEKEMWLATLPAKERLHLFRKKFSQLENLIPHPYIASYLGITNISLSRLRKQLR